MRFSAKLTICAVVCCCATILAAGPLWAEDKGQEDLSLATETKLSAENFSDLGEVIRLCESAMEKGLDEDNTQFAKHLLAATLVQRAGVANKIIFAGGAVDPKVGRLSTTGPWPIWKRPFHSCPRSTEALLLIAKLNFPTRRR